MLDDALVVRGTPLPDLLASFPLQNVEDAMANGSVRYSALTTSSGEEPAVELDPYRYIFTYANYNDLENMGYDGPHKKRKTGGKYKPFTYAPSTQEETPEEGMRVALLSRELRSALGL